MITFPPEATELVKEARDQRGDALDRLLELVWPHAYRIAYAVVRDRGAAEDAAQEACAIVYCKIGGLRNLDSFRALWFGKRSVPQRNFMNQNPHLSALRLRATKAGSILAGH